ncbi:MAG: peptide chain release factor N(5)-glutamine methyltransferase [Proteobacteria bacterium]|nr:peptide chain release factor N(5)-glutamine methyltransferase [Pseudomonadota bacterium]
MADMTTWTVVKVLTWAAADFKKRGLAMPRLEAEMLLSHVLGCRRLDLYTGFDRPLVETELSAYKETISRRRAGESAAYITGRKEFWSLDFEVDRRVLVPRPETEILVEAVLSRAPESGRFLDLGTGSGCIAASLASERPEITVDAVDVSKDACQIAVRNIEKHGLSDRVRVIEGDLFEPLPPDSNYVAIVANPPYVIDTEIEHLDPEVQMEPRLALAGGPDGLDIIRRIISGVPNFLEPNGWLIMEIDPRQTDELIHGIGLTSLRTEGEVIRDLAGRDRVVAWQIC